MHDASVINFRLVAIQVCELASATSSSVLYRYCEHSKSKCDCHRELVYKSQQDTTVTSDFHANMTLLR